MRREFVLLTRGNIDEEHFAIAAIFFVVWDARCDYDLAAVG
jgi:hypothetical protein